MILKMRVTINNGSRMSASPEKLFLVLLLTAALTTTCGYRPFFQPVNDEKLREVQQLVTDIPGFPDFKEVGSNTMADNSSILISKYYVSKAPYEDVKNFYFQFLTSHGWRIAEEKPLSVWGRDYGGKKLTFIKENFSFQFNMKEATMSAAIMRSVTLGTVLNFAHESESYL